MATIRDVARRAEVSVRTVSRVLNTPEKVAEHTRERVLKAVKEMDYQPNALARGLVQRRSRTIGLIVPDICNPVFAHFVRGVEEVALANNYHFFVSNTNEDVDREAVCLNLMRERQVDGLIIASPRLDRRRLQRLTSSGLPIVLLNRRPISPEFSSVLVDNAALGRAAARHLAATNRPLFYLSGPPGSEASKNRWFGFRSEAARLGLKAHVVQAEHPLPTLERGREAMLAVLASHGGSPLAVFAFNDLMALGAMDAARDNGLEVPRDISVVGVDDTVFAARVAPPLTTFRVPAREMGAEAMRLLLERIAHPKAPGREVCYAAPLVVRASCGVPVAQPAVLASTPYRT